MWGLAALSWCDAAEPETAEVAVEVAPAGEAQTPPPPSPVEASSAKRLGFAFDAKVRESAIAEEKAQLDAKTLGAIGTTEGILLLPKYHVEESRLKTREHELLTAEGRTELAKKRYLSPGYQKTLGTLAAVAALLANPLGGWNPNGPEAEVLYEQDEKLRRDSELNELQDLETLPRASDAER